MSAPLLPWDSADDAHPGVVWRAKFDEKYLIEVQRVSDYTGRLIVFDHEKGDAEIAGWDVGLSYGALFGPDAGDVSDWQDRVIDFIDNTYGKQ